jgi:VCBS repeat-containing protein
MIRRSLRKRRALNLEKLDQRLVLAAPVGNPDTYGVNEDAVLGTGENTILNAGFNNTPPIVLPQGSTWDYLDKIQNGAGGGQPQSYPTDDTGAAWNSRNFAIGDSTIGPWLSAPAPLAGGTAQGGAIIDFFPNAPNVLDGVADVPGNPPQNLVTTYLFRRNFTLTAEQAASPVGTVRVLCDDGCAGYINGGEAFRLNLPAGPLTTTTFAPNSNGVESGMTAIPINLANLNLVAGENTIAVELHQNNLTSTDVGFELDLSIGPPATEGFTYSDGPFGTNQPNWESGEHQGAQGFNNTGGLHTAVRRQGFGFGDTSSSAGFSRTFNLAAPSPVTISTRYRLVLAANADTVDYGQAVLMIDGVRQGVAMPAGQQTPALAQFTGDNDGGANHDSGWQQASVDVTLPAGAHTITLGVYINAMSNNNQEFAEAWFDDVTIIGPEGAPGVLFNDTDADGDPLTATLVDNVAHGSLIFDPDGTFIYQPEANYHGPDSFTYRASDGTGQSGLTTVNLNVATVNDVPIGNSDTYAVVTGNVLTVPAATGVLNNDSDVESDPLTAVLGTTATQGILQLAADGSFTYSPPDNFTGRVTFTYLPNDGMASGNVTTATINVIAENGPPVTTPDQYRVDENGTLAITEGAPIPPFRAFFSDFDGPTLPSQVTGPAAMTLTPTGAYAGRGPEEYVFTGNFLRNTADNQGGGAAPATTITLTGLPPHTKLDLNFLLAIIDSWEGSSGGGFGGGGAPDLFNVRVDGAVVFSETFDTANSTDQTYSPPPDGLIIDGEDLGFGQNNGTYVDSAYDMRLDPTLSDIPHTSSTLTVDFYASGQGWSGNSNNVESFALDNLEIVLKNDAITETDLVAPDATWRYLDDGSDQGQAWRESGYADASWDVGTGQFGYGDGDETTTVEFGPDEDQKFPTTYFRRAFDVADPTTFGGLRLELLRDDGAAVYLNGVEIARDNLAADAAYDSYALGAIPNFDESRFFSFDVDPSLLAAGTNVLAVEVHQSDPDSSDMSFAARLVGIEHNEFGVLGNDVDVEGGAMTAELLQSTTRGALTFNSDGTFNYTPNPNAFGTDTFTYRASDGSLWSAPATVTLTIIPGPNEAPVSQPESYAIAEDGVLTVPVGTGVLANDTDLEVDPLTAQQVAAPAHGALALAADGSFVYTPAADYFGPDSFTYQAFDGLDRSAVTTVSINVTALDDIPTANNERYFAQVGQTLSVTAPGVLANDLNPDQGPATVALVATTTHGTLSLSANGSFTYTPAVGFSDTDQFTYRMSDGEDNSNVATVTIDVGHRPLAAPDAYSVAEDAPLAISVGEGVLANDSDGDDDPITAVLVSPPAHGTFTLNTNGSFNYMPAGNFTGQDSFTYHVSDGDQISSPATVTITVSPLNDPPTAVADSYGAFSGTPLVVTAADGVLANDVDVDGQTLSAVLIANVSQGSLTLGDNGSFTYTPDLDFSGTDTFTYRATDGTLFSPIRTVTFTVEPAALRVQINEVMYHPSSENDAEEFIELVNTGTATVDLAGWQFTRGVSFTIPSVPQAMLGAGQILVVAADATVFATLYPGVTNVVGGWTGQLSNRGEEIELSDAAGNLVDRVEYADEGDWAIRRRGPFDNGHEGWVWVADHDGMGPSLELMNARITNNVGQNWSNSAATGGTPGAANSVSDSDIAPLISDVIHSPAVPGSDDPVTITARVRDELEAPTAVTLFWRVSSASPPAFSQTTMHDDGAHGDGAAGDGTYGAVLSPRGDRAVVEFYVRATDEASNARTWPGPTTDNGVQGANATYQVDDSFAPLAPGAAPIYRLVMTVPEDNELTNINRNTNALINTTLIFQTGSGTDVRYNAGVRPRGQGSRGQNPITMRLEIPHDRPWNDVVEMNLNSGYAFNSILGNSMFDLANLAGPDATAVRVRRNGRTDPNSGRFNGYYVHMEVVNGDWAENHLPDDSEGNVYTKRRPDNKWAWRNGNVALYTGDPPDDPNSEGDGWDKQSNSAIPDWSDLDEFLRVMNQASGETYYDQVAEVANIDQFVRYFALMTLMNSRETSIHNGTDDDYDMYRGIVDPRFIFVPHDLDTVFGQGDQNTNPNDTIFPAITQNYSGTTIPQLRAFFQNPRVVAEYYSALKEYSETIFAPATFAPFVDQLLTGVATQNTINNIKNYAEQRRLYVLSQIPTALTVTHNLTVQDGLPRTTNPATVVLSGQADVTQTAKVLVAGVEANWDPFNRSWTTDASTSGNTRVILPRGSTWRYFDSNANPGATWNQVDFDDSAWLSGPAELGYGDGGEATVIGCGHEPPCNNNNAATSFFRTTFNISDISQFSGARVLLRRDDGAAVYLNGQEVVRDNIGPGATFDQFALGTDFDDGATYFEFPLTGLGGLRQGSNTLAVEVKQANATSTDVSFDLELLGVVAQVGTAIPLLPGVNKVLIQTFDRDDVELSRQYQDVWYDDGSELTIPLTTLPATGTTTWTAANGPYHVTGNVTVPVGATLAIEPGTTVYFDAGTGLIVNGRLVAEGTDTNRIRMRPVPGSTTPWAGIRFVDTTQDNRVAYLDMEHGDSRGDSIEAVNSSITLDNLTWVGTAAQVLELTNSSFHVSNSVFPGISSGNDGELIHGFGILAGGRAVIEGNTFGVTNGYNDVIDFTGGQRPGPIIQILNNVFNGGSDDALDFDDTDAHIEGNIFKHFHKNNNSDSTANAIATGVDPMGGGFASEITVVRNFFYDNDHAVLVKEGSHLIFANNTVVDSTIAAINFDEPERPNVAPGVGAIVSGSIFQGAMPAFANVIPATQLSVNQSLVPAANLGLGSGNLDIALGARLANPAADDFSLRAGSAAIGTGPNGIDMGADVPAGASLSGEPPAITGSTSATLTVGGPGVTHYRFSLDGGPFSPETPIATPITLAGLTAATHWVRVIGRNSAGVYQSEADAATSRTWTVVPGHIDLRINEVLAVNASTHSHDGAHPDVIELYNYGSTAINLGGMTVSDDPADTDKFIFPAGTTIPAGGYRLLYAATAPVGGGTGTYLGFNLDRNGETLSIYQSAAVGAPIVDQMSFGIQLDDHSVGVGPDGAWRLNTPTLGAANVAQRTGDPMTLSINEWLAVENRLYQDDRLELHNSDTLPVSLEGLRITDNPVGKPDKHEFAPLSFVAANGYAVLVPDENSSAGADHVNFNLDAQQEFLGLLTADLERIDVVLYMSQTTDVSQGRLPDSGNPYMPLDPPNFGFTNSTSFDADALLEHLRITEIMYNPEGNQSFEFIELKNTSPTESLDLSGVVFTNAIDFEFGALTLGPNQYVVVAKDVTAFQSRYCGGAACAAINVVGPFGGQLDNTGENIELTLPDPFDGTIQDFDFDDAWYAPTDGNGPSLVIRDPLSAVETWETDSSWRTSGLLQGSPGSDDPLDGIAPQVANIIVSGTRWTGSFLTSLDVRMLGQGGYIVPAASAALPWTTIDEITVEFNEPVVIGQSQFALAGANIANYPVVGFTTDGMRATWTLAAPIAADKLRLTLPAIADTSGNVMSSEYSFRFDVLPGDMDGDRNVDLDDVFHNRDYLFTRATFVEYDPLQDIDTNGRVSVADWVRIRNLSGSSLPSGEPDAGGSPSASAVVHNGSSGRTLVAPARIRNAAVDQALVAQRRRNDQPVTPAATTGEAATASTSTTLRATRQPRTRASETNARDAVFSNL